MVCLNGHSETYTETRPNGSRVCRKCQKLYTNRRAVKLRRDRKANKNVRNQATN